MALPSVDDVPELVFPSDGEHELEILSATEFTSKKGRICLRVNCRVTDEDDADDVSGMVFYPDDADDEKDRRRFAAEVRKFQACFGLSGGEGPEDMQGARGRGFTKVQKNRQTGEDECQVKTWV